jgi:hypothetical protein
MPREIIVIPFNSLPVYEASAIFFSTIVYPDALDQTQREKFRIALSRWAVLERAKIDNDWRRSVQQIRPEIFSQEERLYMQTLERGSHLFAKRIVCALTMIGPHLSKEPLHIFGYAPTVDNLAAIMAEGMGMSRESYKTIESRLWAPTKPVAHAALALALFVEKRWRAEKILDEEPYWLCKHNLLLALLFYADVLTPLVTVSEHLRRHILKMRAFRIKEQNTVKFSVD